MNSVQVSTVVESPSVATDTSSRSSAARGDPEASSRVVVRTRRTRATGRSGRSRRTPRTSSSSSPGGLCGSAPSTSGGVAGSRMTSSSPGNVSRHCAAPGSDASSSRIPAAARRRSSVSYRCVSVTTAGSAETLTPQPGEPRRTGPGGGAERADSGR
ncbi:hypothetical protein ACFQV8_09260 [Pseudonocardia benzenivorans]